MTDAIARLEAYADRLDKMKERFRYLGGRDHNTKISAVNAAAKIAFYVELVGDIRAVCAAAKGTPS